MLADDALANIEATDPPVFLRFINLLINDATFLLDEGLSVSNHYLNIVNLHSHSMVLCF